MSESLELLRFFLDYCSAEVGLSNNTLAAYESDLSDFIAGVGIENASDLEALQGSELVDYIERCRKEGLSANTIWRRMVAVRMFYRFLLLEGYVENDIVEAFQTPRLWKKIPEVLSEEQVEALLAAPGPDSDSQ